MFLIKRKRCIRGQGATAKGHRQSGSRLWPVLRAPPPSLAQGRSSPPGGPVARILFAAASGLRSRRRRRPEIVRLPRPEIQKKNLPALLVGCQAVDRPKVFRRRLVPARTGLGQPDQPRVAFLAPEGRLGCSNNLS